MRKFYFIGAILVLFYLPLSDIAALHGYGRGSGTATDKKIKESAIPKFVTRDSDQSLAKKILPVTKNLDRNHVAFSGSSATSAGNSRNKALPENTNDAQTGTPPVAESPQTNEDVIAVATAPPEPVMLSKSIVQPDTVATKAKKQAPKTVKKQLPKKALNKRLVKKEKQKTFFGLQAGVNLNGLRNNITSNTMTTGFHAGLLFDINLSRLFSLEPGLLFFEKGNQTDETIQHYTGNDIATVNFNLDYVELPLDVVLKIGRKQFGRFAVGFGPYIALLAYSNSVVTSSENNLSNDIITTPPPVLHPVDYGLNAFVGCEMPQGFFARAGAEMGMVRIQQGADGNFYDRNYNFSVTVGQKFKPGKKRHNRRMLYNDL